MKKKQLLFIILMSVLLLPGCTNALKLDNTPANQMAKGTIFFRILTNGNSKYPGGSYKSFIVTMPQRNIQEMGYNDSNAGQAISNDGKLIALTCKDDAKSICILDSSSIINKTVVVPESNKVGYGYIWSKVIKKLSLPQECIDIDKSSSAHQLSWSYDNSMLSVICGTKLTQSLLCILELGGNSQCYPETSEKKIIYASWSPKANSLAVSTTTYNSTNPTTFLFDPSTKNFNYLFTGFAPAWSPGGEKIASFYEYENNEGYPRFGLQVYTIADKKTVTLLPNEQSKKGDFEVWPTVPEREEECSISWSLDETNLIFSSRMVNFNFSTLLLFDLKTGDIQFLLDPDLFQEAQMVPQWSPYELNEAGSQ